MTSISIARSPQPAPPSGGIVRETWDAKGSELPAGGLGVLVRREGQTAIGDPAADAAHDNAGIVHDFFSTVLGRGSIDGRSPKLTSVVHFGTDYNNAFWDGSKMTYGDGDGVLFAPLSQSLDVVAHEMAHGITEHTAGLNYRGQSGALNESWSDVFGELVEQWSENRSGFGTVDAAKGADWLIGEDVFTPTKPGDGLRSMSRPGTANDRDPQPAHMRDYRTMQGDNGGVHVNSGIPNKAAYETAVRIGSEKLARIWYTALTDYLRPDASFQDAAGATLAAATKLFGAGSESQAVTDAWSAVGIIAPTSAKPIAAGERRTPSAPHRHGPDDGVVPAWLRQR